MYSEPQIHDGRKTNALGDGNEFIPLFGVDAADDVGEGARLVELLDDEWRGQMLVHIGQERQLFVKSALVVEAIMLNKQQAIDASLEYVFRKFRGAGEGESSRHMRYAFNF
jgi:hypothetical protein